MCQITRETVDSVSAITSHVLRNFEASRKRLDAAKERNDFARDYTAYNAICSNVREERYQGRKSFASNTI